MKLFRVEVAANYAKFSAKWPVELEAIRKELAKSGAIYESSYSRIVPLGAWGSSVLEGELSPESLAFFDEAQNDALVSHVFARLGAWRSALKSLRSCMENGLSALYYMDHPVELALWGVGKHRMSFAKLVEYTTSHPRLAELSSTLTGLDAIEKEYGTLSRAVHGSAKAFRMTHGATDSQLWTKDPAKLGAWSTRLSEVMRILNLLLLAFFRDKISTTQQPGLRKAISLVIPPTKHTEIKKTLGVTLYG